MGTSTALDLTAAPPAAGSEHSLSGLLAGFRGAFEAALAAWLAGRRAMASGETLELVEAIGELALPGGKRLRPALVYYSYRACGGTDDAEVMPLALSTELLHTYLLVHDDIMDHAEMRRSQPSAHSRFREIHRRRGWRGDPADFGTSVAILLGDLAHGWAVELLTGALLATAEREGGRDRAAALQRSFTAMCDEVIGGQYLELLVALRRGGAAQADEEELLRVLRLKSGRYTAERPVELGALLAGAPAETRASLGRYGRAVGEAFQLQDDLLGAFGDAETVGKPAGADLVEGKFTFLIYHALENASPAERLALESGLGRADLSRPQLMALRQILIETGARAKVEAMIEARLETAREALAGLTLEAEGRRVLAGIVDELRERER